MFAQLKSFLVILNDSKCQGSNWFLVQEKTRTLSEELTMLTRRIEKGLSQLISLPILLQTESNIKYYCEQNNHDETL